MQGRKRGEIVQMRMIGRDSAREKEGRDSELGEQGER